jgi:CspA family cold shock protein
MRGTVKFFREDKGFGFIIPDEGGDDVFLHMNDLRTAGLGILATGDRVEFEPVLNPRGTRASDIRLLPAEPLVNAGAAAQ